MSDGIVERLEDILADFGVPPACGQLIDSELTRLRSRLETIERAAREVLKSPHGFHSTCCCVRCEDLRAVLVTSEVK